MALKLSIGIFLLRLAVTRASRIIIYVIIGVVEVYGAFYFFLFVLQCRPSSYFWTQYTGGTGTCIDPKITVDATYAYSAISCVADWALGLMPIFLIWDVQMDMRTKMSVAAILSVGAMYVPPQATTPYSLNPQTTNPHPAPQPLQSSASPTSRTSPTSKTSSTPRPMSPSGPPSKPASASLPPPPRPCARSSRPTSAAANWPATRRTTGRARATRGMSRIRHREGKSS
jgi:hypothetical protein